MLTPTGSGPGQVNKKDHIFLLKLLGITLVAATATLAIEQLDVIKSLVPNNYSVFVTALLAPLLTWIVQWASDNRKEIEESVDDKPPAPPMVCWLPLLLTLSIPGTLFSQEITATSGDGQQTNTFQPYTLIKLKCDGEGKSYVWIVRRLPDGFRPDTVRIENGKELVWTGPPGMYDIDSIFTDNNGILQQLFHRVSISTGASPDNKPVPPDNKPVPPVPDNESVVPLPKPGATRFGYASLAYDNALKIPSSQRLLAEKIAENYGSISAAIFAGGIVDTQAAFNELKKRNQELSSDPSFPAWKDFFQYLQMQVSQDWDANKFKTRSDVAEMFKEIQVGLLASIGRKE